MVDLFLKKKSAKTRLNEWMFKKGHALSHEIIAWGSRNFCNHPLRRLRELMAEGKIRKMAETKKVSYYGNTREAGYEVIRFPEVML